MSDLSQGQLTAWRGAHLAAAVAAVLVLGLAVLAGAPTLIVAGLASAFIIAGGFYVAAERGPARYRATAAAPVPDALQLPDAAQAVLECLDDPLLLLDAAGRVIFANHAAVSIVGPDSDRKHISAVLRTPELLEAVDRTLNGAENETVSFTIPVPVQRHYEASLARSRTLLGAPVLIHIRDLTAMRRAEELRADFVANASHELRTPLAAVSGFIDTLRGHAKNDEKARELFLEIMSVEAGRMRRLIEDLLSLTRIELNEHNPPAGDVDVVAVVRDAVSALAPLAQADGISIAIEREEPLFAVGDRDELTQVFQNLVHNAIKYGREKGHVRVRFGQFDSFGKRDSGQVFVAVEDEGEGIPREAIPRLTERFYRVDVKRSRERGGTGLGLAIVKHILNRHQGRLEIESTLGTGSTFTVFLPAGVRSSLSLSPS